MKAKEKEDLIWAVIAMIIEQVPAKELTVKTVEDIAYDVLDHFKSFSISRD